MKKYNLEIIIFVVNSVYMILELVASRVLSLYFGSSNIVWTCIIGIILLSSSLGNYLGGIIADKKDINKNIKLMLMLLGLTIMIIPFIETIILYGISMLIDDIKIGAIISTFILTFVLPSMIIGILSPIIVKLKLNSLKNVGKISGNI